MRETLQNNTVHSNDNSSIRYKSLLEETEQIERTIAKKVTEKLIIATSRELDTITLYKDGISILDVKNPIEIIEQLKEIVNIGDKYFEALKTMDPIKYVKEWNTGRIKTNK